MKNSDDIDHISELNNNRVDTLTSLAKGAVGGLPVIGSLIGEIVGSIIPQQRLDRVVLFLKYLDAKIADMKETIDFTRMHTEEYIDILEDGMSLASRSLTEERMQHIASLIKNSLSLYGLHHIEEKKLISLFGRLNDAEIIILQSYGIHPNKSDEFYELHSKILHGPHAYLGSQRNELDHEAIYSTYRKTLVELGLLTPNFKAPKKGEFPEFDDKTGMIKASGYKLTSLGRLMLKHLDLECWW